MDNLFLDLLENVINQDYIIASYYIELAASEDAYAIARKCAVGQTIGTWLPVPGITEEMQRRHMGKVINVISIPPSDLSDKYDTAEKKAYLFQIAYPYENFGAQFPMLLTTLLGNDASTSAQMKLVDLYMPEQYQKQFGGPRFGIEGIRELVGEPKRPLLLNMIKPCTGFSAKVGAQIFLKSALGGVDFIKDDELLGNPDFAPVAERVVEYNRAAKQAYEETGKEVIYIPNITDRIDKLVDNARNAVAAGAKMIMVSFSAIGYGALQMLAESVDVPIMGHYASTGPLYEGDKTGLVSSLAVGKFPRLAGADIVMINTPYGGYPLRKDKYLRTAHELSLPLLSIKATMPSCGGGVIPGIVDQYIHDLGTDIILAPGGAIQGHPMGATSGARAFRQMIDANMEGKSIEEATKEHEELRVAIENWGYKGVH